MKPYPYIITISSEKGGVGKTTLASNLAVFLKALRENLPVTILSFDNHFTIDRMFARDGQRSEGSVLEMLEGEPAGSLVRSGQYGVGYIPSSAGLNALHARFTDPMTLTRLLAESGLPGVVIIDTRPDLNPLTQNALYAADRVLIPVKDMASMENCKNIIALAERRGMEREALALIPCLVDERIKYEGDTRDQKTLLRAFAAERGYRCLDICISKSPKVESLTTNPDGKIYPILTHARGTEVHGQFREIALDVLKALDALPAPRASFLYLPGPAEQGFRPMQDFPVRAEGLAERCLICGMLLAEHPEGRGFYYETSDWTRRGFLHSSCFVDVLCAALYGLTRDSQGYGIARLVVAEKARKQVTLIRSRRVGDSDRVDIRLFDAEGEQQFQKELSLDEPGEGEAVGTYDRLMQLLSGALPGEGTGAWLAVHPVDPEYPESVLGEEQYRAVHHVQSVISGAAGLS
ncbi:ParA family protein [Geobacter sp. AOG2]|uniref:ParA family protein n=1 Tax=Geobacter sp. AOG2 TaxID=1566347 RepID=UPI001CC60289|nr:ParA family protein [Geobacter sp. AOG2]GFE62842.1 chromosome partitioning protein ParA [Geobacter sp. AOG2]